MKKINDRFLLKLWLSYSVLLIFALIMGIYMYYIGINSARNQLVKNNYSTLENTIYNVDHNLQLMNTISAQITVNPTLQKLMRSKEIYGSSYFIDTLTASNHLSKLLPLQNLTFAENMFVYLPYTNYTLSGGALENVNLYYHYERRYAKESYDKYLNRLTDSNSYGKIQNLSQHHSTTADELLLYVLPASMFKLENEYNATICFEFNTKSFQSVFSSLNLYETGSIYILDQTDNLMYTLQTENSFPLDMNTLIIHKNILAQNVSNSFNVNGDDMLITSLTSPNTSWTYFLVQPESMAFQELYDVQKTYTKIIIITLLLGGITIIFLSFENYKPFLLIESRLKSSFQEEIHSSKSDLASSLDKYVERLIKHKDALQETLEHQRPIIYSSYLARLMNEIIDNTSDLHNISKVLQITEAKEYMVVSLSLYLENLNFYIDDHIQTPNSNYKDLIREELYNTHGNRIHIYDVDHQSFGILIPVGENEDFLSSILISFQELQAKIKNELNILVFVGLSSKYEEINFTWKAYQQSLEALSHTSADNLLQEYSSIKKMNDGYHFPNELSQQLINAIHTGKEKQVEEILKYIYNENFNERSLSITMIKWLISDLRSTLLKVRFMIPTDENKTQLEKIDVLFQGKKSFVLIENLSLLLCKIFEPKNISNTLISNIRQYIKENYKDSSLGLNKISQIYNISESYFSHQFKEETKENFSEYLEKLRIDLAIKLLKSTEMSITDIATEVGYNSALSFRRAFKKVHGITPMAARSLPLVKTESATTVEEPTENK